MEMRKEIVRDHKNEHREDIDQLEESLCRTTSPNTFPTTVA
jgi:hypothetical protein